MQTSKKRSTISTRASQQTIASGKNTREPADVITAA
jgi:hypothetical protein